MGQSSGATKKSSYGMRAFSTQIIASYQLRITKEIPANVDIVVRHLLVARTTLTWVGLPPRIERKIARSEECSIEGYFTRQREYGRRSSLYFFVAGRKILRTPPSSPVWHA